MKNQATFEWDDPEMKTPGHDRIMVWLHQNINDVVKSIITTEDPSDNLLYDLAADQFEKEIKSRFPRTHKLLVDNGWEIYPPTNNPEKIHVELCEWEKAVVNNKKFIVGYVDLFVQISVFDGWKIRGDRDSFFAFEKSLSVADFKYFWEPKQLKGKIYFEVKPKIKSLGDTIRQVRKYQVYDEDGIYVLVSPDLRFKDILKHQGIPQVVVPSTITGDQ